MSYNTRSTVRGKGNSDPEPKQSNRRATIGARGLRDKENVAPLNIISKRRDIIDTEVRQTTSRIYAQQRRQTEIITRASSARLEPISSKGSRNPLVDRNEKPVIQSCNCVAGRKPYAGSKPSIFSGIKKTGPSANSTVNRPSTSSVLVVDDSNAGSVISRINKRPGPLANSTVINNNSSVKSGRFKPYSATNTHMRNTRASLPKATDSVIRTSSTGAVPKKQTRITQTSTILENDMIHIPSKSELTKTVDTQRGCCCTPNFSSFDDSSEDSAFFSAENSTIWATFNPKPAQNATVPYTSQLKYAPQFLSATDKSSDELGMIIHDGIPSVRKKTLKRDVALPSGYKGIIDLDPHAVKVSPVVLYPEYIIDIIQNILKKEDISMLPKQFLDRTNILHIHRTCLVNWLHKLQQHLGSDPAVIFLSIRLLDKLLASLTISVNTLQLLGIISFWVANKFSDNVEIITSHQLLEYCKNIYPLEYILQTEKQLLQILNFDILSFEEPVVFVRYYIYFLQIENCNAVSFCANYLLECLSLSADINTFSLSMQGSSSVYLSLKLLGYNTTDLWPILKNYPGFHAAETLFAINERIIEKVLLVQNENYKFRQPFIKFSSEKYGCVSTFIYNELKKI